MKLQFKSKVKCGGGTFRIPELTHSHLVSPLMNSQQFNIALWKINKKNPTVIPRAGVALIEEMPSNMKIVGEQGFLTTFEIDL